MYNLRLDTTKMCIYLWITKKLCICLHILTGAKPGGMAVLEREGHFVYYLVRAGRMYIYIYIKEVWWCWRGRDTLSTTW